MLFVDCCRQTLAMKVTEKLQRKFLDSTMSSSHRSCHRRSCLLPCIYEIKIEKIITREAHQRYCDIVNELADMPALNLQTLQTVMEMLTRVGHMTYGVCFSGLPMSACFFLEHERLNHTWKIVYFLVSVHTFFYPAGAGGRGAGSMA